MHMMKDYFLYKTKQLVYSSMLFLVVVMYINSIFGNYVFPKHFILHIFFRRKYYEFKNDSIIYIFFQSSSAAPPQTLLK